MNIPTRTVVYAPVTGGLIYDGLRILTRDALAPGAYIVIEDLGAKITLQSWKGGANITTYKI